MKSNKFTIMINNDYKSMIQWHPEMILISKRPMTWKGFLEVPCISGRNMRIRLKLIVHNYPLLSNAEINFGKEIAFIRNEGFSDKVKDLMHNVTKVSTFLKQLQLLIVSVTILCNNHLYFIISCNISYHLCNNIFQTE